MQYLVATDSVHTTATVCDYLEGRLDADDAVIVVSVPDAGDRDAADALNVADVRLVGEGGVETVRLDGDGDAASAILAAADERAADVVVVGPPTPGRRRPGRRWAATARRVVEGVDVPVVVVPHSL